MSLIFDRLLNRRDSDSIKWNKYPEDVLPLWVADMDFPAPQPVLDALRDRINHGIFGYSSPQDATKKSICEWLTCRHGWSVSPEEVVLYPGIVPAFNIVTRAFTNPGDQVLIQTPAYHPFFDLPAHSEIELSSSFLQADKDGRYGINIADFEKKILPRTRVFMLCNPHNPTGRVFTETELTDMAEQCLDRNIIICSDEIHSDLIFPPNHHIPIASLSEEISQATITLISPSKSFNLAGLKSSAAIIKNPRLRELFTKGTCGYARSINVLGEAAMNAAYAHCGKWLDDLLIYLDCNRQFLHEFVNTNLPGVSMALPEGTYLGWLDFSGAKIDNPSAFLVDHAGVALNAGDWFGEQYRNYARINFGCQLSTLESALSRIQSTLTST